MSYWTVAAAILIGILIGSLLGHLYGYYAALDDWPHKEIPK